MVTRSAATTESILNPKFCAKPHNHLSAEHRLHLWQGRLSAIDEFDGKPETWKRLHADAVEHLKAIRIELDREQKFEQACLPVIRDWRG